MKYDFLSLEKKWQQKWRDNQTYKVEIDNSRPKYYVLDMFPYPSGAGLHVGHPLGYIASDIYTRYKRLKGFNVLHPMGYDAFGLPAEQYAIQTGQHPAVTTEKNIARYREQLDQIGMSFDWSREVRTCDPKYYKWTQWAFVQMFHAWYDQKENKARPISELIEHFESQGTQDLQAASSEDYQFSSEEWKSLNKTKKEEILQNFRIAYLADTMVNWCPALGTVLANDEVKEGFSVRGGHPVEQKKMKQWCLRISSYAQRLLDDLEQLDWSDSLKEMQKNWIGRSEGAQIFFPVEGSEELKIEVFTTRPDTIFGATFMVVAPESELTQQLITADQRPKVEEYLKKVKTKSERDRMANTKQVSGEFTGSYAINPLNNKKIPIWTADYVLASYGSGAIMAVPGHDDRDWAFAKHFNLPIIEVVQGGSVEEEAYMDKDENAKLVNSEFLNGLTVKEAIKKANEEIEKNKLGKATINYRLRDAIFSRQRYWGEPFPIYYKDGVPHTLETKDLPLELPEVDAFLPTETGEPPLGRAKNWKTKDGYELEMSTMPGFAGSSAYYLRYMDPHNNEALVSKEANEYWQDVDLYIGGTEHATGHLIYSRFWNKFLFDLGHTTKDEPFKKLVNQGMIQGRSNFVYRIKGKNTFVSAGLKKDYEVTPIHVDVNIVKNDTLDIEAFKAWREEFKNAEFILEDGKYICGHAVEKMSKSFFNVVNPDQIIEEYGADTFRLYEMFLGPIEQSKPWNTSGIEGTYRFLQKFWKLFYNEDQFLVTDEAATPEELKILHKTLKKVEDDIQNFAFNTAISQFMICVNDLTALKSHKKEILEKLVVALAPFAPHMSEELWEKLGHTQTVTLTTYPKVEEKFLIESTFKCPVSVNGKTRVVLELPVDMSKEEIEKTVLAQEKVQKYLEGKQIKKIIIVPKKIVNLVVA